MIQRQQTLWLLLATVAAILSFMFPFVTGTETVDNTTMTRARDELILVYSGTSKKSKRID